MNIGQRIIKSISTFRNPNNTQVNTPTDFSRLNGDFFYNVGDYLNYGTAMDSFKSRMFTKEYGNNPIVNMVLNKIQQKASDLPKAYTNVEGEELTTSQLEKFLERPNKNQNLNELLAESILYFCSTGNIFFEWVQGIGLGMELSVLSTSMMEVKVNVKTGEISEYVYTPPFGSSRVIDVENILHVKTSNVVDVNDVGSLYGLSPLQALWIIIQSSNEKFKAEASIFKNRGIIGVLSSQDANIPMLKGEKDELQKSFNSEIGGATKYNGVKVSRSNLKYIQLGMSPTDLKLMDGKMSDLRLISAAFGLSSVLFNDMDGSTFNNVDAAKKSAYQDCYIPLANTIHSKLSKFISDKLGIDEHIKVDVTQIEVLKSTTNENTQALNTMTPVVANAVISSLSVDERRALLPDLEPLGGPTGAMIPTVESELNLNQDA